jgi:IPT/TIG domain-containing protein
VAVAAAALVVVLGGGYLALRSMRRPEIAGVSPSRARIGETATLSGGGFAASAAENVVLFGDVRAAVREASRQRLVVEVPELPTAAGRDTSFPVTVRVGGRESQPVPIAVFRAPRIHGLSPDVAMPGEEVTLAGSGWGSGAAVHFGPLPAEVIENRPDAIRVRVPAIEGPPGTPAPVTVAMGSDVSNEAPFLVGRLPLVQSVEPSSGAPGDVVTLTGRGFHWKAAENVVRVGGKRAFVVAVGEGSLKFSIPWIPGAGGETPIELRVPSVENAWQGVLTVQPAADPIDFRFVVEPLDAAPSSPHAVLATALGPAFVVAAAGGRTAADRALELQRRLNDAATALKASRDVTFEARSLETNPVLALTGRPDPILEVSDEDAAAYNEDWTKLGGKGGPVTRARLALWWQAVARDLVLVLLRGEKPRYAAALAPEGRVLGDVFDAARKTGAFGVPRSVITTAKPPMTAGLRLLALRVPASVVAAVVEAPQTARTAAVASPSPPPLQLDGMWVGTELEGGTRKYVTVTFRGRGGSLAYEGGISVSVPLLTLDQPQKDAVRYSIEYRGGQRYYVGQWDGRKITGRISSDPSRRGDVGAFELSPR